MHWGPCDIEDQTKVDHIQAIYFSHCSVSLLILFKIVLEAIQTYRIFHFPFLFSISLPFKEKYRKAGAIIYLHRPWTWLTRVLPLESHVFPSSPTRSEPWYRAKRWSKHCWVWSKQPPPKSKKIKQLSNHRIWIV